MFHNLFLPARQAILLECLNFQHIDWTAMNVLAKLLAPTLRLVLVIGV